MPTDIESTARSGNDLPRSPELMNAGDTGLLVVDLQTRLLPAISDHTQVIWNVRRLLDGAEALGVPVAATEQYPEKLGATVPELADRIAARPSKLAFSCGACGDLFAAWSEAGRFRVLLCGIETHVCVQQTAYDLLADGYRVYLAVDATSARHAVDRDTALRRMETAGVTLTTVESALFEWCAVAGTPEFKQISALVKELPPC